MSRLAARPCGTRARPSATRRRLCLPRASTMSCERGDARVSGVCRIGVRSGGHSWAGNHVRDGGMLLDLSRLCEVEVDAAAMTRHGRARLSRQRAARACSPSTICSSRRATARVWARRLPAAGRLRLERARARPRVHERGGDRRGARRRLAGARRASRRTPTAVGRARRRTGLLRRRHSLSLAPRSAGRRWS